MTQTYIEYLHAGYVIYTSCKPVKDRTIPKKLPNNCFGFRFYDQTEVKKNKEVLVGKPKNYSTWHYEAGKVYTLEEVKKKYPGNTILISNMQKDDTKRVLMTKFGQAIALKDKNIILPKTKKS